MIPRVFIAAACFVCLLIGPAKAQLLVQEGKVTLAVSGGEHLTGTLTVLNNSGEAFTVKVYWEDFKYQAPYDGAKIFLPAGTGPYSASQWITFSPQEFSFPAFGKQKIDYTINVPPEIDRGHYGVLFFEKVPGSLGEESGVSIVSRVGTLFFVEPKDKNKKAALLDIKLAPQGLAGNFANQGNVVLIPSTSYYLMDAEGMVRDRGETARLYVPPGETAPWEIPFPASLKAGTYTLVVNADLEAGDVVVKEIEIAKDASGALVIQNIRD